MLTYNIFLVSRNLPIELQLNIFLFWCYFLLTDSLCLGAVWVWWLNWYGLILSIVLTQRAAGSAPCVSVLPASHWFSVQAARPSVHSL